MTISNSSGLKRQERLTIDVTAGTVSPIRVAEYEIINMLQRVGEKKPGIK